MAESEAALGTSYFLGALGEDASPQLGRARTVA